MLRIVPSCGRPSADARAFIVLAALLLFAPSFAAPVAAQALTGYQLRIFLQGGGPGPVTTFDIPVTAVTCGVSKLPAPGAVTNPSTAVWDDPADPARDCRWVDTGSGPLFALPFSLTSTYTAAMVAINAAGAGPESARSNPFSRPGVAPAAPGNVRLFRP